MDKKPLLIYQKTADRFYNRITIPKKIIEQWGKEYYMYIYEDKIELIPVKLDKK